MLEITEEIILEKGFEYIKSLSKFKFVLVDYRDSQIIKKLFVLDEFKKTCTRGFEVDVYIFERKTEDELLKEKQQQDLFYQIHIIEQKFNVKLTINDTNS